MEAIQELEVIEVPETSRSAAVNDESLIWVEKVTSNVIGRESVVSLSLVTSAVAAVR